MYEPISRTLRASALVLQGMSYHRSGRNANGSVPRPCTRVLDLELVLFTIYLIIYLFLVGERGQAPQGTVLACWGSPDIGEGKEP